MSGLRMSRHLRADHPAPFQVHSMPLPVQRDLRDHIRLAQTGLRRPARRDLLFVNASKGLSAAQLSRDLDVQHKTAFVLMHKLRDVMTAETLEPGSVLIMDASMPPYPPATCKTSRC